MQDLERLHFLPHYCPNKRMIINKPIGFKGKWKFKKFKQVSYASLAMKPDIDTKKVEIVVDSILKWKEL